MSDKPYFRFYPGAYEDKGRFIQSHSECDCCGKPCVLQYDGNIYTALDPKPEVCARCISDGSFEYFMTGRSYSFHDIEFSDNLDRNHFDEVMLRTPGIACYNPFKWPVLNSRPMVFIGYGDNEEVWGIPCAQAAMKSKWLEAMGEELDGKSDCFLVFKDLDKPIYRASIDFC